ncbi:27128_t:CDS:2 [Dentiscutata erythropus]|uniref:27128_t:CDS:1 n=1 Tax=Dentiscutata erythropus TaxID=1348616 RepID=A0A9N9EDG4_9GLOM|nr:27128_t:CDS:2 [Dentiscutata erythropus]
MLHNRVSTPINLSKHLYKRQFSSLTNNTTLITLMIVTAAILGLLLIFVIAIVLYRQRRNQRRISDSRLKPLQLVQNEPLLRHGKYSNSKSNKFKKDNRYSLPATKSNAAVNVRKFEIRLSMPVELAKPIKEYTTVQL